MFRAPPPATVNSSDTVLIVRPKSQHFQEIFSGIQEAVEGEMTLVDGVIQKTSTPADFQNLVQTYSPKAIVLMDNVAVGGFLRLKKANPSLSYPPTVIVGTLFASRVIEELEQSTGILYEIPAVTALVDLRKVSLAPLRRVGVIYRENHEENFEAQRRFCVREKIDLVGVKVKSGVSARRLSRHIQKLFSQDIDALWVMNDGDLLSKELITGAWIPRLRKSKVPVVVGIKSLIRTQFQFGDYAVYPDHYELGVQTGDLLFDLMDSEWRVFGDSKAQQPISINKQINVRRFQDKRLAFREERLQEFDQVITE